MNPGGEALAPVMQAIEQALLDRVVDEYFSGELTMNPLRATALTVAQAFIPSVKERFAWTSDLLAEEHIRAATIALLARRVLRHVASATGLSQRRIEQDWIERWSVELAGRYEANFRDEVLFLSLLVDQYRAYAP